MDSRSACRAGAALAGLALAAGTATAAHADSLRHLDPTGDVVVTKGVSGSPAVDAAQRVPDIQQLTVLHTRWTVSVATSLRGLGGIDNDWRATVVTSKGDSFSVVRGVSTGGDGQPHVSVRRNGYRFACDGITATRTPSGVIAKLPTRCLGDPWRVRVGVQASSTYNEYDDIEGKDDSLRTAAVNYYHPALSSWIVR